MAVATPPTIQKRTNSFTFEEDNTCWILFFRLVFILLSTLSFKNKKIGAKIQHFYKKKSSMKKKT